MSSVDRTTLRDLRRTRTRRRLGEVEWFDVAYRVYLVALVGVIAVVLASDAVSGLLGDDVTVESWVDRGPSILGLVVAVALTLGLRSGAEGGPVSIEVADVRHVLLAPVDRRMVMTLPIAQRLRSTAFAGAAAGAVLAQLVARELDAARGGWAAAGALFGAVVGAVFVTAAVLAHAARLARWLATAVGAVALVWQAIAAWATWTGSASSLTRVGPFDLYGSLALWGVRQRAIDFAPIGVTVAMIAAAFALGGRLRIEPLVRRGALVSQLRFAATTQDLRTVVLLRRQLRAESPRSTPWLGGQRARPEPTGRPRSRAGHLDARPPAVAVWERGVASLRRLPAPRVGRIVVLAVAAGAVASLTVSSSPLFAIGLLALLFLLGLESIEPLAQEIDRPHRTERLPVDRGWLFGHHLVAPAALLAVAAPLGVAGAAVADPGHTVAALVLAFPIAVGGAAGPVVAAVRDAPLPIGIQEVTLTGAPRGTESPLALPEFAGASTALGVLLPLAISAAGAAPVLAMRADPSAGTAVRSVVGVAVVVLLVLRWIRRRDVWNAKIRSFFAEGRAAQ